MAEWDDLLASIATTIADYREHDLARPTPEHVERWVGQFDAAVQLPILHEMDHVLKTTYFSRARTAKLLARSFQTKKLAGDDPCAFWMGVKFLDIQGGGASQKEMLALFDKVLSKKCGFDISSCGEAPLSSCGEAPLSSCGEAPHAFVYLDDAIFSGNRVRQDLETWIANEAPAEAKVHVIAIASHGGGEYYANRKIKEAAQAAGKDIELNWWHAIKLEDRRAYTTESDVLRPIAIPDDEGVRTYVAGMHYPPNWRVAGHVGRNGIFSSDAGRQLLENEFLKAGVRIRQMCQHLNRYQRPLGNMILETLGFGSLIVTFRNCPNNAPLALWTGDPWYPLFPRTTNSDTSMKEFMATLAKDVF